MQETYIHEISGYKTLFIKNEDIEDNMIIEEQIKECKKMVKHIILWTLKDEFNNDEVKTEMKKSLEALKGVVPGLLEIEVQIEKLPSSNADVMLYSVLESEEALKGYAVHPAHVEVADTKVRPFTSSRSCIDFVV